MMKKVNKSLLCYILLFSMFSLFSFACQRVMDDGGEEDMPSSDETALKITAPVKIYLLNIRFICMPSMRKETVRQNRR